MGRYKRVPFMLCDGIVNVIGGVTYGVMQCGGQSNSSNLCDTMGGVICWRNVMGPIKGILKYNR